MTQTPLGLTRSERVAALSVRVYSALVLCFLVAPILVVIPLSFNDSAYFSYPMSGLSLRWYEMLLTSEDWRRAFMNSFIVGIGSTILATTLGTLAALGLSRPAFPLRGLVMPLLISPMIIPIV